MANIKSAIKRIGVNEKKNEQNRMVKSEMATLIKKFRAAVSAKEFKLADALYKEVTEALDKAAGDNIIHKNKAANNKAKLAKVLANAKKA
jgi:small subunit ribosomal protein S20